MCDLTQPERRSLASAVFNYSSDSQLVSAMAFILNDNPALFLDAMAYALEADAQMARYRAGQRTHISERGALRG